MAAAVLALISLDLGWRVASAPTAPCAFTPAPHTCPRLGGPPDQTSWRVPSALTADACAAAACAAQSAAWSFNGSLCLVGDASKLSVGAALCAGWSTSLRASSAPSSSVPLDLGWRVAPYASAPCGAFLLYPRTCLEPSKPQDSYHAWQVPGVATAGACAAAACDARSSTYAFNGSDCWVGDAAMVSINTSQCESYTTGVRDPAAWPPALPPEAAREFDDTAWAVIDLPHDAAADTPHVFPSTGGQGFRHPTAALYRKHFRLQAEWEGAALRLQLPGAATSVALWLNGVPLSPRTDSGYLPLSLALDAAQYNLTFGGGADDNVLLAWTDNMWRTGWWEEGAGLTRGGAALLIGSPTGALAPPSAISAPATVQGAIHARSTPADGLWADAVAFSPAADVLLPAPALAALYWTLRDATGTVVGSVNASARLPLGGGTVAAPPGALFLAHAELWSVARPYLYTLRTELEVGGVGVDAREDAVGARSVAWSGESGLALNAQPVKMRGFCEHGSWGGVGGAVPARVDLLRLQQLRALGGNALRTSHNPPAPQVLDIADRLGVLVLPENRVLAHLDNVRGGGECGAGGCRDLPHYAGDVAGDAGALARRDRLHAASIWISICNELGCGPGTLLENDTVLRVKEAIVSADASRAVTGNLGWQGPNATRPGTPFDDVMDVVGMSHQSAATLAAFHAASPFKPVAMTECCSCETMRAADADLPYNTSIVYYSNEASACLAAETQISNAAPFCAGTMVWTLHDYGGEPDAFPHVSSSFGSLDYAGFEKPAAGWFAAWWRAAVAPDDPSRPPLALAAPVACSIVEQWAPSPNGTRTIHVYANAPFVRLLLPSGAPAGAPAAITEFGAPAVFYSVPFAPGVLVAQALAADGATVLASSSRASWGAPAALLLTLDAPSPRTGTGSAVLLDGEDVALVRATVVDAQGNACGDAENTVSFAVTAGPARIVGTHNGHPALGAPASAPSVAAYGGLARGIARVTLLATGSAADRAVLAAVNVDAGRGNASSAIHAGDAPPPPSFTVTALSPGLAAGAVTVALSTADADGVLQVAAASVAYPV